MALSNGPKRPPSHPARCAQEGRAKRGEREGSRWRRGATNKSSKSAPEGSRAVTTTRYILPSSCFTSCCITVRCWCGGRILSSLTPPPLQDRGYPHAPRWSKEVRLTNPYPLRACEGIHTPTHLSSVPVLGIDRGLDGYRGWCWRPGERGVEGVRVHTVYVRRTHTHTHNTRSLFVSKGRASRKPTRFREILRFLFIDPEKK